MLDMTDDELIASLRASLKKVTVERDAYKLALEMLGKPNVSERLSLAHTIRRAEKAEAKLAEWKRNMQNMLVLWDVE